MGTTSLIVAMILGAHGLVVDMVITKHIRLPLDLPTRHSAWVKWLRMQGHRLPATLEVTGSNPGPCKINLIKIEKKPSKGFLTLI